MSILTKDRLDPKVASRMLIDDGTFATVIQIIALAAYGAEIYDYDPMEVVFRLEEDFHVKLTETLENKLKAIMLATSTDIFYEDGHAFTSIGNTLLNGDPGLDNLDPLTIVEVMFATYEVELNHGPGNFSPSVLSVIEAVMNGEAIDPEGGSMEDPNQYIWDFLEEMRHRLKGQLLELGVDGNSIPPIRTPHVQYEAEISSTLLDSPQ